MNFTINFTPSVTRCGTPTSEMYVGVELFDCITEHKVMYKVTPIIPEENPVKVRTVDLP